MGGKLSSRRMVNEYSVLCLSILDSINNRDVYIPRHIENKTSFGDIDIYVKEDSMSFDDIVNLMSKSKLFEIKDIFKSTNQIVIHSDEFNIDVQVDINFIKTMQYLGLRKINLIGTVKIHGTNSSVGLDLKDNSLFYQSRNRVLSLYDDNYDFAKYIEDNKSEFLKIFDEIKNKINTEKYDSIIIYGELAGKGIQNKVAVSQIDRFFALFSVVGVNKDTVDELDVKLSINESIRFYPVETFGIYNVQLDLDNVHLAQQEIKDLTISVENECPVGKYFGVSGTGEGIVFTDETKQYSFKSKGEKHSVSKVKVIANVDIEKINKIKDFVDYSVTENRLNQGIEYLKEMNKKLDISSIGDFLRWLANDVLKEEQDVITENGLDNELKAIMKSVSSKGRKWFMDKINE